MTVIFHSDDEEARNGFKATWKAVETGMSFGVTYLLWSNRYWHIHYTIYKLTNHQDIDKIDKRPPP